MMFDANVGALAIESLFLADQLDRQPAELHPACLGHKDLEVGSGHQRVITDFNDRGPDPDLLPKLS